MYKASGSPLVRVMSRLVSPYIMLFGLYVVWHGHYSPGGGFQGGALMAAAILLIRLTHDCKTDNLLFNRSLSIPLACVGVLIYLGIGLIPLFLGGRFLDYGLLPMEGVESSDIHAWGILGVEVGVALAVMAVLISIYDNLMDAEL